MCCGVAFVWGLLGPGHSMPQMPQLITSLLALRTAQNACAPADGGVGQKSHLGGIQQDSGSLGFPPAASDSTCQVLSGWSRHRTRCNDPVAPGVKAGRCPKTGGCQEQPLCHGDTTFMAASHPEPALLSGVRGTKRKGHSPRCKGVGPYLFSPVPSPASGLL